MKKDEDYVMESDYQWHQTHKNKRKLLFVPILIALLIALILLTLLIKLS